MSSRLEPLERRLDALSPAGEPDAWAVAAYRLGVALTEAPSADGQAAARRALTLFERAAQLLDAQRAPVEHARILNASGAARRALGQSALACDAFERAAQLMEGRARAVETGAAWSNLGLAQAESGDPRSAIITFDRALSSLRPGSDGPTDAEQTRAYASAALNRAQAQLALADGDATGQLTDAADGVQEALTHLSADTAPLHIGMLEHTLGLIHMRASRAAEAREAFTRSLTMFTRSAFTFQYAVATFNRGRANEAHGELEMALVDYEAAAQTLDPRLHREQWLEAARRLADIEQRLKVRHPGAGRSDHIAGLLGAAAPDVRMRMTRDRLIRLVELAPDLQRNELTSSAMAALHLPPAAADAVLRATLEALMELPDGVLQSALLAQLDAHATLGEHDRLAADRRLDTAIQELVLGPQRVRMRDILYASGWERP